MANRRFNQFALSLEPSVVSLFLEFAVNSDGTCTIIRGKGFSEVVHIGAGDYRIILQDSYPVFLNAHVSWFASSTTLPARWQINSGSSSSQLNLLFVATNGTSQAFPSGAQVYVTLLVGNSTA